MKRSLSLAALASGLALAGCEEPRVETAETAPLPAEAPVAEAATDQATDAADTAAATDPATDDGRLPPANPSSEESVQPESETLFY